jgi:phosphatidylserine synthase
MPELQARSRQPRRGIYILPTLFTIGTIFCGFYAVINTMKGSSIWRPWRLALRLLRRLTVALPA